MALQALLWILEKIPLISRLGRCRCSFNEVLWADDCVDSVPSKPKINNFVVFIPTDNIIIYYKIKISRS